MEVFVMLNELFDYPFSLSDNERAALVMILLGDPFRRIPFMNVRRNRTIANGMAPVVWASELRLIVDAYPAAMGILLEASQEKIPS
jgi:hypothetical protein